MAERGLGPDSALPVGRAVAAAIAWQYRGETRVTVAVKAAFAFTPEGTMTLAEPPPIHPDEVMAGGRRAVRSTRLAADLVPYRKRADVTFSGFAHAPTGRRVETMRVRLGVFSESRALVDKAIVVKKSAGFERLPIDYEHAFGGSGFAENPFGEGFAEDDDPDALNLFDPKDPRRVACFAPLAKTQEPRRTLRGALPLPGFGLDLVPLPDDFQLDYFQAAPVDQRVDFLRGDEWVVLEGLHPTETLFRTRLPSARGVARIHGLGELGVQEGKPLAMNADALHIAGDEERCVVTWRGSFAVATASALAKVRVVAGVESEGAPVVWPSAAEIEELGEKARAAAASAPREEPGSARTVMLGDARLAPGANETLMAPSRVVASALAKGATLPFRPPNMAPPSVVSPPPRRGISGSDGGTLPITARGAVTPAALPFAGEKTVVALPENATIARPETSSLLERRAPVPVAPRSPLAKEPELDPVPPAPVASAPEVAAPLQKAPVEEPAVRTASSPWAPAPLAPPPPPAPKKVERRTAPKMDVGSKLYGTKKKS